MTDRRSILLDAELTALRTALSERQAPPKVGVALAAAFAAQRQPAWRMQLVQWWAPSGALIASVVMSAWMLFAPAPAAMMRGAPIVPSGPFIALSPLERIALEPNPRVIETTVPKMMLASLGVPVAPENAGETLRAEMLVSAAGQPLALRISTD